MTNVNTLVDAALRYAARGVPVYPLAPGTKVPLRGSNGFHDATTEEATIREWWRLHPFANIGAPTGPASGFWCLDVDAQHRGPASLKRHEQKHGPLPETAATSTPSGGEHLYWLWAGPATLRNSTSRVGPGIDVRGDGGSIPLPPPTLRDGLGYRWTVRKPLAEAPAWLIALAHKPGPPPQPASRPLAGTLSRYAGAAAADEINRLAAATAGSRNDQLNRSAFALAGLALSGMLPECWCRVKLEETAVAIGLDLREARRTIASAWAAAGPREVAQCR